MLNQNFFNSDISLQLLPCAKPIFNDQKYFARIIFDECNISTVSSPNVINFVVLDLCKLRIYC